MQKTILYAVLNWGLGHATRSIPIIQHLIDTGNKLIIASDGEALNLLQKEFPRLIFEKVCAYNVVYASNSANFNITLAKQIPKFIKAIKNEHNDCIALCKKHKVDYIISDNRYGFYHNKITSAFICHQLHLLYEDNYLFEKIVNKSYQGYLKKFTQIWVPDFAAPFSISGKLSKLNWKKIQFIGADSRFKNQKISSKNDILVILSGPEPQRSLLEDITLKQIAKIKGQHTLIRGTQQAKNIKSNKNVKLIDFATSKELNQLVTDSEMIVCRSGYTSVIDLLKLKKKALLIPTPGQVEQEYLAKNLAEKNWFYTQKQNDINIETAIHKISKTEIPNLDFAYNFNIIQQFLSSPIS